MATRRPKKLKMLSVRCSDPFSQALESAAKREDSSVADWVTRALATALAERGITLPTDCPEYQPEEAPKATLNAIIEREATALLPKARERSAPWAEATAKGEWGAIRNAIVDIDDPALWNDFIQSWSIPGRTARQKLHALKFRLQAYRQRDTLPGH